MDLPSGEKTSLPKRSGDVLGDCVKELDVNPKEMLSEELLVAGDSMFGPEQDELEQLLLEQALLEEVLQQQELEDELSMMTQRDHVDELEEQQRSLLNRTIPASSKVAPSAFLSVPF